MKVFLLFMVLFVLPSCVTDDFANVPWNVPPSQNEDVINE
jgi:hypothetical protein